MKWYRTKKHPRFAARFLVVIVAFVALACSTNKPTGTPGAPATKGCEDEKSDTGVCKIARKEPAPKKGSDGIADLGLESLPEAQQEMVRRIVADVFDPCGAPYSFAETLRQLANGRGKDCRIALPLARFVVRQVASGEPREAVVRAMLEEQRRLNNRATFRLEGRPRLGAKNGKIVIVEFFDYECPYCRKIAPKLEELVARYPEVALVAKQCPIEGHLHSQLASTVAIAAHLQGRYWEFHRALFSGKSELNEAAIKKAATAVGLDWKRLRADSAKAGIEKMIREDLEDADNAPVEGTPSLWLDNVEVPFDRLEETIRERLQEGKTK